MKPQVAPFETKTMCIRIVPKTGANIMLTRHPVDLKMSNGNVYLSASGYDFTGYQTTASVAPAMVDLEGILGIAGIGIEQISNGTFDNARAYLFYCDYTNPIEDYEPVVASILGRAHLLDHRYRIEESSLVHALNQSVGKTYNQLCQKQFGGTEFAGCKLNLTPLTHSGTVTAATSSQTIFTDSGLTQSAGYFALGYVQWLTGRNVGTGTHQVKVFASGVIELYESLFYPPLVGETFTAVAGCAHTVAACKAFGNILNFGGFPNIPTQMIYTQVGWVNNPPPA